MRAVRRAALVCALIAAVLVVPASSATAQNGNFGFGFEFDQADCFIDAPLATLDEDQTTSAGFATTVRLGEVAFVGLQCTFLVPRSEVGLLGGIALGFDCLLPYPGIEEGRWNTNLSSFTVTPQVIGPYTGEMTCFAVIPASSIPETVSAEADVAGAVLD